MGIVKYNNYKKINVIDDIIIAKGLLFLKLEILFLRFEMYFFSTKNILFALKARNMMNLREY